MNDSHLDALVHDLLDTVGTGDSPTAAERDRIRQSMLSAWETEHEQASPEPTELVVIDEGPESPVVTFEPSPDSPRRPTFLAPLVACAAAVALIVAGVSVLGPRTSPTETVANVAAPTSEARIANDGAMVTDLQAQIDEVIVSFSAEEAFIVESFGPSHVEVRATDYVNPFPDADNSLGGSVLLFTAPADFDLDELITVNGLDSVGSEVVFGDERVVVESILIPDGTAAELGCVSAQPCLSLGDDLVNGPSPALELAMFNDVRALPVGDQQVVMLTVHTGLGVGPSNDAVSRLRDQIFGSLAFSTVEEE